MSLKERTYSILVVSSTDSFASAFIGSLPEIRYYPVLTASSVSAAKRMLKEKSFDFVIINSPLSDDIGVRFAIDLCSSRQIAVLLLVKRDIHSDIHDKVAEYGVFTLPKPTSKPTLLQALSWMESSPLPAISYAVLCPQVTIGIGNPPATVIPPSNPISFSAIWP